MIPKSFFEDEVTQGVARGTFNRSIGNRFTIVNLPVGYGKTVMAVLTAVFYAKILQREIQIAVIAPKAKRLDNSFKMALESAEKYYNVKFKTVHINGQMIGTFAGFTRVSKDKKSLDALVNVIKKAPTIFILDETHMTLRNGTSKASKGFLKLFRRLDKEGALTRVIGLTATPVDTSIIDVIGYLIFNGDYTSQTDFYRKEIVGFSDARGRGMTQKDIENLIVDSEYNIHENMFCNYSKVIDKFSKILYAPKAPKDFHIPENVIITQNVALSTKGQEKLDRLRKLEKQGAFKSTTSKTMNYLEVMTTDENMLKKVLEIVDDDNAKQPIIFYQYNMQKNILRKIFTEYGKKFQEINAESHSFFTKDEVDEIVIVQYQAGASAFESKDSNTSIYMCLPDSAIQFEQSLGRNARREQEDKEVYNHILLPIDSDGSSIDKYEEKYMRIINKNKKNEQFIEYFRTEWGEIEGIIEVEKAKELFNNFDS